MALMETLQDAFDTAGAPNATRWPVASSGVTVTGGVLQITDSTGIYPVCQSAATYTIAGSYLLAKVVPAALAGANTSQETYLSVDKDDNNYVSLVRSGTNLLRQVRSAGTAVNTTIGTYNATTMAWWRIRHDGTMWFTAYSADGTTWTEQAPFTTSWAVVSTMRATLMVGKWSAGDPNAVGTFDNVNLSPIAIGGNVAAPESFSNEASTTLTGAILAGATSAVVASSAGFPATPFRVRISGSLTAGGTGTEYAVVTAAVGTTWTISRGAEAPYSTGLGFASGAKVEHVVTTRGLYEAGPFVNVMAFGAKADHVSSATGAMTSASATLTDSANGKFQSGDVGKIIIVTGAGSGSGVLTTTISAYVSATQVTLATTAGTTVAGATYQYATDNSSRIQAALDYAATLGTSTAGSGSSGDGLTGATVFVPPGVYLHSATIAIPSRVRLLGAGREATTLRRTADVVSVSVYGAGTADADRNWYSGLEHLTVDGNDKWVTGVDIVYASQFLMRGVFVYNVHHIGIDLVEVWDSSFTDIFLQFCGGIGQADQPSLFVRSTRAASGFGSSTDTSNELKFNNFHTEHFRAGAIKIGPGLAGALNGPNGIYFTNVKTESYYISFSTPFIWVQPQTERIHLKNVYSYAGNFLDGSAVPIIQNDSVGQTSIRDVYAANGAVATISSAVNLNISGSGMCVLDGAYGSYTTAATVAHVNVAQAGDLEISNIRTNLGTRISGYEVDAAERMLPITADVTTTATSAANLSTLTFSIVTPGTYRVSLVGMYRSSLNTAGPRFGVGGTATATGSGNIAMYTSATAATVTEMTAINTTYGTNPGTATTSFRVEVSFVAVVTASGTLGIRWNMSAAGTATLRAGSYALLTRIR